MYTSLVSFGSRHILSQDVFCHNNNIHVSIIGVGISSGCWILVSREAKKYSW